MAGLLTQSAHPLLDARALLTSFPEPLSGRASPEAILAWFVPGAEAPLESSDAVRLEIRTLLRHGGFKPAGRSKPASEYLIRAAETGSLTAINPAVDACNAASLHGGVPISVIDLDRSQGALNLAMAPESMGYVFNASGQEMDVGGLICLWDESGPCANPVKDSQRTKTSGTTQRTLSVIWGTRMLPDRSEQILRWYRELVELAGGRTEEVRVEPAS